MNRRTVFKFTADLNGTYRVPYRDALCVHVESQYTVWHVYKVPS